MISKYFPIDRLSMKPKFDKVSLALGEFESDQASEGITAHKKSTKIIPRYRLTSKLKLS